MKINYCLPIIKSKKEEILEIVQSNSDYSYFEVWLDYIEGLDDEFVKTLIEQLGEKLILVFRRKNLEQVQLSFDKRLGIISLLNKNSTFIDLDIFDQKEELDYIKNNKLIIKTIVSYHNYQETPGDAKLSEIIDTMKPYNPSIFKIATKCTNPNDALRLLGFLLAIKEKHEKCIVLGMGKLGMITRIFGSIWGNEMIFAPKSSQEESAEGQLTKEELEKVFEVFKPASQRGEQVQNDN